jgi:hypothetical protein
LQNLTGDSHAVVPFVHSVQHEPFWHGSHDALKPRKMPPLSSHNAQSHCAQPSRGEQHVPFSTPGTPLHTLPVVPVVAVVPVVPVVAVVPVVPVVGTHSPGSHVVFTPWNTAPGKLSQRSQWHSTHVAFTQHAPKSCGSFGLHTNAPVVAKAVVAKAVVGCNDGHVVASGHTPPGCHVALPGEAPQTSGIDE